VATLAIGLALACRPEPAAAFSGTLDPGFASSGTLSHPAATGANLDEAFAATVDGDGRILAAGYVTEPGQLIAVVRLQPNGSLDSSFAGTGTRKVGVGTRARGLAIAVQPDDDKIVIAGYAAVGGAEAFAVVRLLTDGNLDPDFGDGGIVTTPFGTRDARAQALALQDDGKIVTAGWSRNSANRDVALARYDADGNLDPDFGDGGQLTLPAGTGNDEAWAIALSSDERIVIAGYAIDGSEYDVLVARLLDDGALDPSFNGTGLNRVAFADGVETARGLAIDAGDRILVAGDARIDGVRHFALARLGTDGVLDPSFGNGGKVTTLIGEFAEARAIALSTRGRPLVAGRARMSGTETDFAVARYSSNGLLDPTFGTGGLVTFPIGDRNDDAFAIAMHEADGVVVAGSTRSGSNTNFGFARLLVDDCGDGFLDPNEDCDLGAGSGDTCCSTTCTILAAASGCREAAGSCDVAEVCDGVSPACPADVVIDAGVSCHASGGVCDVEEKCNGLAPQCPADQHVTAGTVCRAGSDLCDAAEACDGISDDCPVDQLAAAGATCRPAAGGCDPAELCDGATAQCPADELSAAGTACRAVADACDVAEACDGSSVACPTDDGLPDGDGDGTCDEQDVCLETPDPAQSDGDGDGIGDACDACTNGVQITNAVAKIGGVLTPPGDDTLRLTGTLTFSPVPTLAPAVHGARVVLAGPGGAILYDVSIPPGTYSDETRTGWRSSGGGKVLLFKSPTLVGGLVRKVKLTRAVTPGRYHVKITGQDADLTSMASLQSLDVIVTVDPSPAVVDLCGEVALDEPGCAPNEDGSTLVCR